MLVSLPQKLNIPMKQAIIGSGHSSQSIAQMLGRSKSWLSKVVHGRQKPSEKQTEKLASILNIKKSMIYPDGEQDEKDGN